MTRARVLQHPVLGDRVTMLVTGEESAGEICRFEYLAATATPPPPNHLHARQERIEVLAGTLRCRLGDEERVLQSGDTVTIPPGTPHAVWNADPSGCRAIAEFRPALDTQTVLDGFVAAD